MNSQVVLSLLEVLQMIGFVAFVTLWIEAYLYAHFNYSKKSWFFPAMLVVVPFAVLLLLVVAIGPALSVGKAVNIFLYSVLAESGLALFFRWKADKKLALPYMLIMPGFVGLALLIAYPLVFEVYLAFHDLKLTTLKTWTETGYLPFVNFEHFYAVFTKSPLSEVTFWQLLGRTLWWTVINVFFHVLGGLGLALLLNNEIKLRGIYRTLLIIPWAMPQVVAVLAMKGEFHSEYGFVNIMIGRLVESFPFLASLGIQKVQWLSQHPFLTCTIVNVWLGIPFMMVVILGGLQSVPKSYYEAASIDGASRWQKFRHITLPLLRPVLAPAVTLGTVWTFNNINVIYLVTGQSGGTEDADILVSALYKAAFSFNRFSYSAAFAIVIFLLLFAISMLWLKFSKGTDSAYD